MKFARRAIPAFLIATTAMTQSKPGVSFDQTMVNDAGDAWHACSLRPARP